MVGGLAWWFLFSLPSLTELIHRPPSFLSYSVDWVGQERSKVIPICLANEIISFWLTSVPGQKTSHFMLLFLKGLPHTLTKT